MQFVVQIKGKLNQEFGSGKRARIKDGYSPEFILRKLHLCGLLEIRRHLLGQHGKSRWADHCTVVAGIRYIFKVIRAKGVA